MGQLDMDDEDQTNSMMQMMDYGRGMDMGTLCLPLHFWTCLTLVSMQELV